MVQWRNRGWGGKEGKRGVEEGEGVKEKVQRRRGEVEGEEVRRKGRRDGEKLEKGWVVKGGKEKEGWKGERMNTKEKEK